jgi:signal peptidase I
MKRILVGVAKLIAYLGIIAVLAIYTPKLLSKYLHTPYPMAAVTSNSMWPTLKAGDLVLMRGISGGEAKVGQIVIYQNEKGFTIHRLIEKKDGKLITKGDANNISDPPILESEIVGRAVYFGDKPLRVPKLGKLAQTINAKK